MVLWAQGSLGQPVITLGINYSQMRDPSAEWVYNAADIDHSKIVWAREIPGADLAGLFDYFHTRQVWLVEPDLPSPRLTPWPK